MQGVELECRKDLKLRMVDEGPGGGGEEFVGANVALRRRPAHAGREPPRRRAVHDAIIGPCGRGVVRIQQIASKLSYKGRLAT